MPLVLLCGQPSSGKSTAAAELRALLEREDSPCRKPVVVIDEPSLHLERNSAYQDTRSEKNARGVVRSAVDRATTRENVVIVDTLNNIKGYRYELWCIARAAGTRYCVLHCDVPAETCRTWNAARGEEGYREDVFDDLTSRFERPDGKNRWDAPLFTVRPEGEGGRGGGDGGGGGDGYGGGEEWGEGEVDYEGEGGGGRAEVLAEVAACLGDGAEAQGRKGRELTPTIATKATRLSDTNLLYELDRATQEVVTAVVDAQAAGGGALPAGGLRLAPEIPPLVLSRELSLPELRRQKRNFVKITTQNVFGNPTPPDSLTAKRMFADYLQRMTV